MMKYLGQKRNWGRITDQRMQDQYAKRIGKKDAKKVDVSKEWNWDAEMPSVVLHELRRAVYRELAGAYEDYTNFASIPMRGQTLVEPMPKKGERDNIAGVMVRSAADILDLENAEDEELAGVLKRGPVYVLQDLLDFDGHKTVCEQFDFRNRGNIWAISAFSPRSGVWGKTGPLLAALHRLQIYLGRELEVEREKGERNKIEVLTGSLEVL